MNNQLIIDMIKTLASHLDNEGYGLMMTELVRRDEFDMMADLMDCEDNYIVFGGGSSDYESLHDEMVSYLNNEGYAVINWDDPNDTALAASFLNRCADNYYVFKHQEDGGHLDEMARMLRESAYMHTSPMYNRLQSTGIYHGDQQLHELLAFDGMMIMPTVDRYLEDSTRSKENPLGDEWHDDFTKALDHFWSGHGSELNSEKTKFIMRWLADQV